jgi:hypothetical protein
MAIYRVLLPVNAADRTAAAERAALGRDGFCWPACLFGPLWLLAGAHYARAPGLALDGLYWLSALWLGLEGPGMIAAARRRAGFRLVDITVGANATAAEHGFFSRWVAEPPPASSPPPAAVPTAPAHVIGLFPEAGG